MPGPLPSPGSPSVRASPRRSPARSSLRDASRRRAPRRIVALAPSAAEILFALGAAARVVGVSDFAADLPEAAGKTQLGGFVPDLERIAALRPDLVVVSRDGTDRSAPSGSRVSASASSSPTPTSSTGSLPTSGASGRRSGERPGRASRGLAGGRAAAAEAARRPSGPGAASSPSSGRTRRSSRGPRRSSATSSEGGPRERRPGEGGRVAPRPSETLAAWNPASSSIPTPRRTEPSSTRPSTGKPPGKSSRAVRQGRVPSSGSLLERPGPRLVDALERLVEGSRASPRDALRPSAGALLLLALGRGRSPRSLSGACRVPLTRSSTPSSGKGDPATSTIVRELRLPRALLGLLVGGALALSGAALQALLRNPLADPYLLGVSGGAAAARSSRPPRRGPGGLLGVPLPVAWLAGASPPSSSSASAPRWTAPRPRPPSALRRRRQRLRLGRAPVPPLVRESTGARGSSSGCWAPLGRHRDAVARSCLMPRPASRPLPSRPRARPPDPR